MPNSVPEPLEIINKVAEEMSNSVPEQWEITNEVSTTDVDVCGVTASNNAETGVVAINEDRAFFHRFKECLKRYEAISATQQALTSDLIDAFEDDKVYNKIGADGEKKHYKK